LTPAFIFILGFEMWLSAEVPIVAFPSVTAADTNTSAGLPCYVAYADRRSGSTPGVSSL